MPTNRLSVFDHFGRLALKELQIFLSNKVESISLCEKNHPRTLSRIVVLLIQGLSFFGAHSIFEATIFEITGTGNIKD